MPTDPSSTSSPASPASPWEPLRPIVSTWRTTPVQFVTEALGATPEPWQAEALREIAGHDRVAIRSGHGVGKSAMLAWLILWWLLTRAPARVAATAPTAHQLRDVLWGEIGKWHRRLKQPFRDWLQVQAERVTLASAPDLSFAVARTARKEEPEAFQGHHSEHMLFIVDEASGVPNIIFEVGEGSMSTAGAKTVLAGNPTQIRGYFYDAFHAQRASWRTMRVACGDSGQVAAEYATRQAASYGVASNVYRVRVLGEFPLSAEDGVIRLDLCEAAVGRDIEAGPKTKVTWGLDVARFGDDRTALVKRRGAIVAEKATVWRGKDTMQTVGLVKQQYDGCSPDDRPDVICVDVIGLGAGVVDRLRELELPVVGINVAEMPGLDEQYLRLRDELWFMARKWFEDRACSMPEDEDLIADLTSPKFTVTSSGKIKVESKAEMKARGVVSPDLGDAFCLTFAAVGTARPQKAIDYKRYKMPAVV